MTFRSYRTALLFVGGIVVVSLVLAEGVKKPPVLVTLAKDTTYITEPLRPDGYPDYVAALNQMCSKGVTPENNAAVLFWKAVGPGNIAAKDRAKYFEMLGIAPLSEKGDYFITLEEWVKRHRSKSDGGADSSDFYHDPLWDQQTQAMQRPWSKDEFPLWTEWLKVNEKPLELLIEASNRPRRYDPMIGPNVISILLPATQQHRDVARALAMRAMLRAHDGKVGEAWEDLLACHRLGRLVGQGATLVDFIIANVVNEIAYGADRSIAHYAGMDATTATKMLRDIDGLTPLPKMADAINYAERFALLDSVFLAARQGRNYASDLTAQWNPLGPVSAIIDRVPPSEIDWNHILRIGNSWYDRIVDAVDQPKHSDQQIAIAEIQENLKELQKSIKDITSLALLLVGNPRQAVSQRLGEIYLTLFIPSIPPAVALNDRYAMETGFTRLAFALAVYRADHGSYPTTLAELSPKCIAAVPKDLFGNTELHYEKQGGGYLLYSVGENGKDDGGKGFQYGCRGDEYLKNGWDDLVVRMPMAKQDGKK